MKKKIDWEVVGVVLFIFTLFPFVWFYRELIQQTYEIRRKSRKRPLMRKPAAGRGKSKFGNQRRNKCRRCRCGQSEVVHSVAASAKPFL